MKKDIDTLNNEKILLIDNIIKRLKQDFIIDDNFNLLDLINHYGIDFILNDLSSFIKENYKNKK